MPDHCPEPGLLNPREPSQKESVAKEKHQVADRKKKWCDEKAKRATEENGIEWWLQMSVVLGYGSSTMYKESMGPVYI